MSYIHMQHLFLVFLDHTQRCSTVSRTPLDEWSVRRRDLYLTTHDTHNRKRSMPLVSGERPQAARLLRSCVRIPPGAWIFVCCECRVLSGRGLCDELITRPEESYRLCCVVVCDLETSRIGAPCIHDISSLGVKPSVVDLHYPHYNTKPIFYIFEACVPVCNGIIWNTGKIRENATDYLPISGEDDLPPIFMKWDTPSIIWCNLCFWNVLDFFFFHKFLETNTCWTLKININIPMSSVHDSVHGPN